MSSSNQDYLFWISVAHLVPQIGFVSSMLFGVILLFLTVYGASKIFGSYKYLLIAFTLLGMAFSTIEIIVFPNVHNYRAGFLFFSFKETFGITDIRYWNIPLAAYTFFSATISLLSVQFIYRYWAIFDNSKLKYFTGCYSLIWVGYCTFFGLQYALGTFFFLKLDEPAAYYLREEMLIRYHVNVTDLPSMALVAYDPFDGSVRWFNLMGIVSIFVIVNVQYSIMIYCGWSMHTQMEDKIKNFSENLKKHHKQFFKSLVMQITAPTLILFIPISIINFIPVFNFDISFPSGALLCSFTLYPAMDSMIVMYVVSDYKHAAKKAFRRAKAVFRDKSVSRVESTTINSHR
ncbi:hypothetical protein CAEBREN_31098 [Caenorhabditis brenneri]|uniref:Seven TM Receptor n=1 Tax=Caenorhabditis brenneri TaxID=135651 RepID=G0NMS3_CAEBE|nr:hypothetical protein CAEBREN_31098 [Caenorhabditis brenneri]